MSGYAAQTFVKRMVAVDMAICLFFNRACRFHVIHAGLAFVSRLGDGVFWYSLMLILALFGGDQGLEAACHMGAIGLINLVLYKLIKEHFGRRRPCSVNQTISLGANPLDQYSFPSGHTMHAVGFSIVCVHYSPELGWLLAPFTLLVALSRMVLGLHFPTDVVAGAYIGAGCALLSFSFL